MNSKLIISLIVAGALGVGLLNGCNVVRDGVAMLIGAPTTTEIKAEEDRLKLAEAEVTELEKRKAEAEANENEARRLEELELQRVTQIKAIYGEMAMQYSELEGAAQDAMMRAMEDVRHQLDESNKAAKRIAQVVAGYVTDAKRIAGEITSNNAIIDDAFANLQGFENATLAAIANVGGFVRTASESAGLLGVPGAAATGKIGGNIIEGIMTSLLVGGTGIAAVRARRGRKDEADKRAESEEQTMNLTRIIHAVQKFKLIKDDKEIRNGAKEWAGEAAHLAMEKALLEPGVIAAVEAT